MITEQYVTFQTAQLLKEAGFNVPVRTQYSHRGNVWCSEKPNDYNSDKTSPTLSRPTQQLAARWLREAHGIYVMLTPCYSLAPSDNLDWVVDLFNLKKAEYIQIRNDRKVVLHIYEEAFEYGIQQALKLII